MDSTTPAVVDTDVVSFLFKNHALAPAHQAILAGRPLAISLMRIKSACQKKGPPITFADAWTAAAALQLNVPLVTHNAKDYRAVEKLAILTAAR
jgi:predicted nucleic acid-binding protein